VEAREANIRAGYVYVISNIGAFGERMIKIGLTRRLDPTCPVSMNLARVSLKLAPSARLSQ
jgi:hypothetical protein